MSRRSKRLFTRLQKDNIEVLDTLNGQLTRIVTYPARVVSNKQAYQFEFTWELRIILTGWLPPTAYGGRRPDFVFNNELYTHTAIGSHVALTELLGHPHWVYSLDYKGLAIDYRLPVNDLPW